MTPVAVAHHLGSLHPAETLLVALLAFGPFVVLAAVVHRQRRGHRHKDDGQPSG